MKGGTGGGGAGEEYLGEELALDPVLTGVKLGYGGGGGEAIGGGGGGDAAQGYGGGLAGEWY